MSDAQSSLITRRIREIAIKILSEHPGGIRSGDLQKAVSEKAPHFNRNTIAKQISVLANDPSTVRKPARGLLMPAEEATVAPGLLGIQEAGASSGERNGDAWREEKFYEPFRLWLEGEGDQATEAVVLSGAGMRTKWGTPDVVGIYKPKPSDPVKFSSELIAAEIKVDATQSIVAFGQSISYRLFCHKTLIVMPSVIEAVEEDHFRLRALCELFGAGYILFDRGSPDDPNFRIVVPPRRFEPDMFYVNAFARRLLHLNPERFDRLFR